MFKKYWPLIKKTFSYWSEDNVSQLAAALAYYTLFSLAPLLVILIAMTGFVFGKEAAQGDILNHLQGFFGAESAKQIQAMIASANKPYTGILSTIIGVAILIFGASGVFSELSNGLNRIWGVKTHTMGIFYSIKLRLLAFLLILGLGFLLLVSLALNAIIASMGEYLMRVMPGFSFMLLVINFIIPLLIITVLFAMIFKILPAVDLAWRDVWLGAFITALLFTLGKFLLGIYLGMANLASTYGAASSLIVILIWVYYSTQILFLGAEFTKVYTWAKLDWEASKKF